MPFPQHVALAHLVLLVAPLAALTAVGYALLPGHRPALRWSTVLLAALTTACALWLSGPGHALMDQLTAAGASAAELEAAEGHAKNSDTVLICSVSLVLLGALSATRRFSGRWTAWTIALLGVGLLAALWVTVGSASEAVWLGRQG